MRLHVHAVNSNAYVPEPILQNIVCEGVYNDKNDFCFLFAIRVRADALCRIGVCTAFRRRSVSTVKVVLYARVSTIGQETEGQSIQNQQRAMYAAAQKHGWKVQRYYQEAASAGTIEGRAEFTRMLADLPKLKPQCIVIQTLDRFTRNLKDGLNLLEELRGHHVGLLPLDWRRTSALDIDDDRDWADVVAEFTAAERERRRISRRVKDSYEGRRARGAVLANRTPFGLLRQGDHFVPGPDAWIVAEAEQRLLRGDGQLGIVSWVRDVAPEAGWKTIYGLYACMVNEHYVRAGARTPERHRELRDYLRGIRSRFGQRRENEHEFTGLFRCSCGELLYGAVAWRKGVGYPTLRCNSLLKDPRGHNTSYAVSKVADQWLSLVRDLQADDAALERWAKGAPSDDREKHLQRRLAAVDQRAAALKRRRDAAFDLLGSGDATLERQARQALTELDTDEMELRVQREAVLGELARIPSATRRDPEALRAQIAQFVRVYQRAGTRRRNELNRALVRAIGSHPVLYREGDGKAANRAPITILWTALTSAARASSVSRSSVSRAR